MPSASVLDASGHAGELEPPTILQRWLAPGGLVLHAALGGYGHHVGHHPYFCWQLWDQPQVGLPDMLSCAMTLL
jgi:hypothetical protein